MNVSVSFQSNPSSFNTHSIPCTCLASMNSSALIYSFRSFHVLSKAFPFRLKYLDLASRVDFSTRPEFGKPSRVGGEIRASKSLIEDEAELSDCVRTSSLRGKFTSDEDDSGQVQRKIVDVDMDNDRSPVKGREGVSNRFDGSKRGKEGEVDRFGGSNRRRTVSVRETTTTSTTTVISARASMEKFYCNSYASESMGDERGGHFFDLPSELIKNGSGDNDQDDPVSAAFLFDKEPVEKEIKGVLKMSCSNNGKSMESSLRHVRFSTSSPVSYPTSPAISPRILAASKNFNAFLEAQAV